MSVLFRSARLRSARSPAVVLVALAVAVALAACAARPPTEPPRPEPSNDVLLDERFADQAEGRWHDGEDHGAWRATYDGYGATTVVPTGSSSLAGSEAPHLTLSPAPARTPKVTHGALVTSRQQFGDLDVTVRLKTVRRLRRAPNAWEVGWLLWHYADDQHFYYVALKPNGWELGKEDPAYPGAQRFLRSGTTPSFPVGAAHTVRVRQVGHTITVWGDGRELGRFTDAERPYGAGRLGLYTEDAVVNFYSVVVRRAG